MGRFFTSDQHFGHANLIIKFKDRPFASVEEMDEEIVRRHNTIVCPGDTVYHLGDFSLSKTAVQRFLPRLNGEHHLICGNHDWPHPVQCKNVNQLEKARARYFEAGFKTIQLEHHIVVGDRPVLLHHMPPFPTEPAEARDTRYQEWRPKDQGWIFHGHVHNLWKKKNKWINVGVDKWAYAPASEDELVELMKEES